MKNTFGRSVCVTLFGESHGAAIGAVIDGLAPGLKIDRNFIRHQLDLRRPHGAISTARREADDFQIISGEFEGKTTGTPLCIIIPNQSQHSKDYSKTKDLARPGHADFTAFEKYHGYADYRGGGHFSGRITAALTAAGAIAIDALKAKGILIGTHVLRCGKISDREFCDYEKDIATLSELTFPVLDNAAAEKMHAAILDAKADSDSIGGILQTVVIGLPSGLGEPWFDTVEGILAHALFSIPAVKGVEFGAGFALADMKGSEANDPFRMENGKVITTTNNNGGVNGGITNGMPLIFQCAVKPTPSIYKPQETVDFTKAENATVAIEGRHDPAIIHRARVVADSITALTLCDMLALRYGTDWLAGG